MRVCVPLYVLRVLRVRRHVLRSWFPPTPGNPGTPPRCVYLYVYAGHDPDHRGEHGKNSWDVLKWDVLKSVGRKYEKGKLVKYKSACLCTLEHPINELVHVHELRAMISNSTLH